MLSETETVLDRRRLRRHLSFWRVAAIAAVVLALGALVLAGEDASKLIADDHIARVTIEGTITENRQQLKMLKKLEEDEQAKAVIVFINSPGGTSTGGEAVYLALRDIAAKKPVVAQFGTLAASAGYIVALGTDHIVSRGNTITGSIGVLVQWPEFSGLLDKVGVKFREVKSGELKAAPSPFTPMEEPARRITQEMVDDSFDWFVNLVRDRRKIDTTAVPGLEKGRIFTGRQALTYKLVDEIGGEETAVRWLEEKRSIEKDLKIVDWKPSDGRRWSLLGLPRSMARNFTSELINGAGEAVAGQANTVSMRLDGLVSVWQPSEK
ncbi:MAG: signal peptide peptidase SppA [Hyphomicrobiaceae bacterium]|nr:signal peptide peptidase SppA [Hyphomicrobiaceae bacterium]